MGIKNYVKNSSLNALSGIVNRIITLLIPFLLRTILIYTLGEQYLGISNLFSSILQVLNLADLGFSSAITYNMYKPIAESDEKTICALLNLYRKIYLAVGVLILFIGLSVLPFLEYFIEGDYPSDINLHIVYLIYLSNTVISYIVFSHKRSLLSAHQKSYIDRTINSILHIIFDVIRVICLFVMPSFYLYIIFFPIATFIENCIIAIISKKMYPQYKCIGKLDKEIIRGIQKRVIGICFQKFGNTFSLSFDSIIISSFLGLSALAIYSNYYYIIAAIMGFIWITISSVTASVGNSIASEGKAKSYTNFKRLNLINNWAITFCVPSLICLYQHFMYIWMGKELMADMSFVIYLVVYFFIAQTRKIIMVFKEATGLWWEDRWKSIVAGILNLVLNIILVQLIGMNGVIISTIISYLFIELPWETKVIFKCFFTRSSKPFYIEICKTLILNITLIIACWNVCALVPFIGIGGFILKGIICVAISNVSFILLNKNTDEFMYFKNKFTKK